MIQFNSVRTIDTNIDPEIHNSKEAQQLKQSCQQFEAILWSKLFKDMRKSALSISGSEKDRPWQQMEELSQEMATDDLVERSGGAGLWKVLYNSLATKLAADKESKELHEAKEKELNS